MNFEGLSANTEELAAEAELGELLKLPSNAFLLQHPENRAAIDEAESARVALDYARSKISERANRSLEFSPVKTIEGITLTDVNPEALRRTIDGIFMN